MPTLKSYVYCFNPVFFRDQLSSMIHAGTMNDCFIHEMYVFTIN